MDNYRQISFWFDSLEDATAEITALPETVDVAVIGGGYTGLWTAYYLKKNHQTCVLVCLKQKPLVSVQAVEMVVGVWGQLKV